MIRPLPLILTAAVLMTSAASAAPSQPDVESWLNHRHAALTTTLDQTITAQAPSPQAQHAGIRRPVMPPMVIRVSTKPMHRLPYSPNI
jgi:hypothetical protein